MVYSTTYCALITFVIQVVIPESIGTEVLCYCSNEGSSQQSHRYQQQQSHNYHQQQSEQSTVVQHMPVPIPVPVPVPTHWQSPAPSQDKNYNNHNNNNHNNNENKNKPPTCEYRSRSNCNPGSCRESSNFDAASDAKSLKKAVDGWGTDEDTLINILTHRSDEQIEMIRQEYVKTGRSLLDDIKGDTSFKTKKLLVALVTPRPLFVAQELYHALDDDDEDAVIEIMTTISKCAMLKVASEFETHYHESLSGKIKSETDGDFQDFLIELSKGSRQQDQRVDQTAARKDAEALVNAGIKKVGTDEKTFTKIFTTRSFPQLKEVLKQYNQLSSSGIKKDIESEMSGDLKKGMLALIKNAEDQPGYLADELEDALSSKLPVAGDNKKLIRIMRGSCGVDLGDIKEAYARGHNGKSLADRIKGKTYKDYEKALLSMLN